jgi:Domain of unknown function (DUF4398)
MNASIERTPHREHAGRWHAAAALVAVLIATGCASTPAPSEQIAASSAAMTRAGIAGARELAPAEMRVAREKWVRLDAAMAAKDYRHALWLAQEAQVDAELAEVKARSVKATSAATAAVKPATRAAPGEPATNPR